MNGGNEFGNGACALARPAFLDSSLGLPAPGRERGRRFIGRFKNTPLNQRNQSFPRHREACPRQTGH